MEFCKVALTFESVDEILWCDHSHGASCFPKFYKTKFGIVYRILPLATFGREWINILDHRIKTRRPFFFRNVSLKTCSPITSTVLVK